MFSTEYGGESDESHANSGLGSENGLPADNGGADARNFPYLIFAGSNIDCTLLVHGRSGRGKSSGRSNT